MNPAEVEELYRRHVPDAVRLGYLLTGNRAESQDVAQDAFLAAMGRFRMLRNPDKFQAYLRRTVVRTVLMRRRSTGREEARIERNAVSGDQRELPRLPDAAVRGVLDSAGLVSVDGGLIVSMAWTDGGRGVTVVAVLPDGAEEWTVVDELDPDDFTPGSEVTTSFPPGPTVWTGEWLFGRSWMPTAMAPGNGRVVDRVDPQSVPCGSGSVSAWTGDELLSWGGQNCRREGPSPQVDTGVSIRIRPTD